MNSVSAGNPMSRHQKRLRELMVLAEDTSQFDKHRHAAAIYLGNKLIAVGVNQLKTHPLQARFGINHEAVYLHAEIDAIKNALKRIPLEALSQVTLYVAKSRAGKPKMSKPCAGCQKAILHFGIPQVYWTDTEDTPKEL